MEPSAVDADGYGRLQVARADALTQTWPTEIDTVSQNDQSDPPDPISKGLPWRSRMAASRMDDGDDMMTEWHEIVIGASVSIFDSSLSDEPVGTRFLIDRLMFHWNHEEMMADGC